MIAVVQNDIDTCKWLIEVGSDITFKNKKGQDAFAIAKLFNRQDMVETLQNKLSKKPVQSVNSYEFLMNKLLEEITPIIEDNVKKLIAQEMKQPSLTTIGNKKELLKEKRVGYFIESFSGTTQMNSQDSSPSFDLDYS